MSDIVCLSTANWHPIPTRKQQVMGRLRQHRILYFDPPVSRIAPLKDPSLRSRLGAYRQAGERVHEGLTVYATPPVWPFYNRVRWLNRVNQRAQTRYIQARLSKEGFVKPLLWCYSPTAADAVRRLPHSGLVYDCVDRHSAYGGLMKPEIVDAMEADLARQADVVFATARGLYDRLRVYNEETHLIPNGADFALFNQAAVKENFPIPDEMRDIPSPILGFVGMLQPCIDYDLLLTAADARPDWSFVFLGAPLPGVDIGPLRERPNVHLLGRVPYRALPAYLAHFDVCLNLFRSGDLARDVSPLKFYEYLAAGRPIVSTPQPLQVGAYADVVHIAGEGASFIAACEAALSERSPERMARRIEYGRKASWDARVQEMERILMERGLLNGG